MNQKRRREAPQIPAFRFLGFSGEWQFYILGDISKSFSGGTPSVGIESYYGGNIPFIRSGEIGNSQTELFITEEGLKNSSAKMVKAGDILYALYGATSGEVFRSKIDGAINQAILAIYPNSNFDSEYLAQLLRLNKEKIINKYLQGGQGNLSGVIIKSVKISAPNFKEQTQIGEFFQTIDRLIELQSEKVAQAERYKKAMLQKLFPQKGETIPKLRFVGFSGEWEKQALEKISERFDNLRVPVSASDRVPGDTPYYGANGVQDYVEGYTHDGEFILIAEDGANDLLNYPVRYVTGKIWVNNHAHVLSAKKNKADNRFLSYSLKTINMAPYLVGGSRAKLNASTMMKILLKLPSFEEQTQIGNFFQILDKQIEAEGQKLDRYQTLKRAMLQRMFV